MSLHEYNVSKEIAAKGYPFYAIIMAALRHADSANFARLEEAFPEVHAELQERYNAPGGLLVIDCFFVPDAAYTKQRRG